MIFALGMISFNAMAVDGYKDAKFGMTEKEFFAKKLCHFEEGKPVDFSQSKGISLYSCPDFSFANTKRRAVAFFLMESLAG
ncbi:hypothetical protein ID852_08900 [Xenorhabdus sp. 42]|uniref:Uncharacterized protein n=3 Tax=Xenorhabdus szentirmaii TaxID=290112 RepID=W1IXL5_9GAMM|nr:MULTISPECIES: hypothetical protein [unclassified Xenorhabdus]PHM32932.1 hypothetical protein Xsze_03684 [Xenorhabdus szentirmaii DSM 16338]PHM40749.1 hypothetical protein Xszus_00422 [Xenorhabdus szentirmaii]MBD2793026.1 hypothetical protein [Xenorhabdus sp. CUL]MBD2820807.1 hypothetical protein [Xenorhabdus sp. 42]MBD2824485.1 hypothetical protein [Xenorhabdus sp. 5]